MVYIKLQMAAQYNPQRVLYYTIHNTMYLKKIISGEKKHNTCAYQYQLCQYQNNYIINVTE